MDWAVVIPVVLSVATALAVASRRTFRDVAHIIELLTELRERIGLAQVGIETLGIVDSDIKTHLAEIDRRLSDLERYLQLRTQGEDHPFIIRAGGRRK
jgi:hypothetical protein